MHICIHSVFICIGQQLQVPNMLDPIFWILDGFITIPINQKSDSKLAAYFEIGTRLVFDIGTRLRRLAPLATAPTRPNIKSQTRPDFKISLVFPSDFSYKSPFNYPLYLDCYIHNWPEPVPYSQDDMLQVMDVWIWSDLSHISIEHQRLSLCQKNYKHEIWDKWYSCSFYEFILTTQSFVNLNVSTMAKTQSKHVHAQHLFVDCPIPKNSQFDFIKAANNTNSKYLPRLFVAVTPLNNVSNNQTVFLPVCLNSIGNRNNSEIITFERMTHKLSACTMITSDSYIDARFNKSVSDAIYRVIEWIEFHRMVGFDHFVIYDNSENAIDRKSESKLYKVLLPYIEQKIVTYIVWPTPFCDIFFDKLMSNWRRWGPQIAAFNSCIGRFGAMTQWMSIHDVDEFMAPLHKKYKNSITRLLDTMNADINSVGFVQKLLLNCTDLKFEKHSDYERNDLMISILSHYQCSFRTLEPKNKKLIIRPMQMRAILIHFPTYFYPNYSLNEYVMNGTSEAVMYHARTSALFKKNDYYILPPDKQMIFWFDALHKRLARQRIAEHWNEAGLKNKNNNEAKVYWWNKSNQ